MTVKSLSDGGNIPGASRYAAGVVVAGGADFDWVGAIDLDWLAGPGTYWAAFTADTDINAIMPGTARRPLAQ
ncbi:MAG: hypothetical protein ACJAWZ_003900 [Paracoccaceae bacterium]